MSEKESESAQVYVAPELTEQKYDLDQIVFDLDAQMDLLSSHADGGDYLAAIGSGLICGILDVVWGGAFDLRRGREWSSSQTEQFVVKVSRLTGYPGEDLQGAVRFLEKQFCIPSDKNTPDFGGGLQHHLRDFAHHPTAAGLVFSLLTQFTQKAYGTDTNGAFVIVPVPKEALGLIGKNIPEKLFNGVVVWFFHLVSDMAGSSSTAGKTGGTGIPGPLLAMAKEMAVLPVFQDKDGKNQLSVFLSKLFNGTLLAEHDENGKILKDTKLQMDLRGELGLLAELARQALPVAANECMVRAFYMIRRLSAAIQERKADSWQSLKTLDWQKILPVHSPALTRMLTVATGVFTTVDFGAALIGPGKWWVCVNYAGIGRFAVAIGQDVAVGLRARDLKLLRKMYEEIRRNTFRQEDADLYERIGCGMGQMEFGLTMEQVEILYNIEALKTEYDAEHTQWPIHREALKSLKREWLQEWKNYISAGLPSFLQVDHAVMHWYTKEELIRKIEENEPQKPWLRLVLLEAMLFEPYYPLSTEQVKKGKETKEIPSTKYKDLNGPAGYNQKDGHIFGGIFDRELLPKRYDCPPAQILPKGHPRDEGDFKDGNHFHGCCGWDCIGGSRSGRNVCTRHCGGAGGFQFCWVKRCSADQRLSGLPGRRRDCGRRCRNGGRNHCHCRRRCRAGAGRRKRSWGRNDGPESGRQEKYDSAVCQADGLGGGNLPQRRKGFGILHQRV